MPLDLSVCIVTYNESKNIEACLDSVSFADEIIVVDSYSEDDTVQLSKQFTDKVYLNHWQGCGVQKQYACSLATKSWILILDADERVSDLLAAEIKNVLSNALLSDANPSNMHSSDANPSTMHSYNAFNIRFKSHFCGQAVHFGAAFRETHLRLFKKSMYHVVPRIVHFRIEANDVRNKKINTLTHPIIHYSFPDLTTVINKFNSYSSYSAQHKSSKGQTSSLTKAILRGVFAFVRNYFLRLGMLDGKMGFIFAVSTAESAFYKYLKINENS